MIHGILSILVGVFGGLAARVIYSFFCGILLLPLALFSVKGRDQVSTVQAALALCLLGAAVSLYDFAVIKSWEGIVEHLTWGDYTGIVIFCVCSACIPDREGNTGGDREYNGMILDAGIYLSLFISLGMLLMEHTKMMWAYISFSLSLLLSLGLLIGFHHSKKLLPASFGMMKPYEEA